jgi:hypothetical protein
LTYLSQVDIINPSRQQVNKAGGKWSNCSLKKWDLWNFAIVLSSYEKRTIAKFSQMKKEQQMKSHEEILDDTEDHVWAYMDASNEFGFIQTETEHARFFALVVNLSATIDPNRETVAERLAIRKAANKGIKP